MGLDVDEVERLRKARDLTQDDAGKRAFGPKSGKQAWHNIIRGGRSITLETLDKLAAALDVDPCDLLAKPAKRRKGAK